MNEKEYQYYLRKGCEEKCIKCPAGSLVFWDSRLCHFGKEPLKERKVENERCIIYLCYLPRKLATQDNLKKKIKAFEELRTTSHWANKPKLFPVNPRTYGAKMPKIEPIQPPVLNNLGKRLAGYELTKEEIIEEHGPKAVIINEVITHTDIRNYINDIYKQVV